MNTNFKIASFTEIEFLNQRLDLHNHYSFYPENLVKKTDQITLTFIKLKTEWTKKIKFQTLKFTFSNYGYFNQIEPDPDFL